MTCERCDDVCSTYDRWKKLKVNLGIFFDIPSIHNSKGRIRILWYRFSLLRWIDYSPCGIGIVKILIEFIFSLIRFTKDSIEGRYVEILIRCKIFCGRRFTGLLSKGHFIYLSFSRDQDFLEIILCTIVKKGRWSYSIINN